MLFLTVAPLTVAAAIVAWSYATHKSALPYLPYVLVFFFLVAPYCSSQGFRVLDECDCFIRSDGLQECFSRVDYALRCPSPSTRSISYNASTGLYPVDRDFFVDTDGDSSVDSLHGRMPDNCTVAMLTLDPDTLSTVEYDRTTSLATLTVLLYAVGWPLGCALCLWHVRIPVVYGPPTALSTALGFLVREYSPTFYWWELVVMGEKIVLIGLLSLLRAASMLQLSTAICFSLLFFVLRALAQPHWSLTHRNLQTLLSGTTILVFAVSLNTRKFQDPGEEESGELEKSAALLIVIVLGATLPMLLLYATLFVDAFVRIEDAKLRWVRDGSEVRIGRLPPDRCFHSFISHSWASAQDQARPAPPRQGLTHIHPHTPNEESRPTAFHTTHRAGGSQSSHPRLSPSRLPRRGQ